MAGAKGRSGGPRQGVPGRSYSQRSDMHQPVRTAPGQPYGDGVAQQRAQQAIPLPNQPGGVPAVAPATQPVAPPNTQPAGPGVGAPPPPAGAQDPLRPTENPTEPVTAGLPFGPGAGPSPIIAGPDTGIGQPATDPVAWLHALYQVAPNPDIADLLQHLDR